ncbi:MAG: hypothetical protein PHH04_02885 [Thomasclavelia sp.]|nr:hypothetical protein [Thomasclavelia sp.]
MKRIISLLMAFVMMVALVGCSSNSSSKKTTKNYNVKVLTPSGAPSLAFSDCYEKITKKGSIEVTDGTDLLVSELSKGDSSDYDIIVAPVNLGAKLISAGKTTYKIAGVLTWGNLYLVGTSKDALNSTGELALFGEGAVPQKVYESAGIKTSLTPTYYTSATGVQQELLSGKAQVGLLAEPLATVTIAKGKESGKNLQVVKDMQTAYGKNGYPQAAVFVKSSKKTKDVTSDLKNWTNNGYKNLKSKLEKIGADKLGLPNNEVAIKTIKKQNIHYKDASKCTSDIKDFLKLFNIKYTKSMLID